MRLVVLCVACGVFACSPSSNNGGPSSRVYWTVEPVGTGLAPLDSSAELPDVMPRVLPDGSIVATDAMGSVRRRDPATGEWALVPIPTDTTNGFAITGKVSWFKDMSNYGGSSVGSGTSLNGGWAVVNGTLHECEGTACIPVFQGSDGTFVTRDWASQWWMTWKPGQNIVPMHPLIDDLDIHDYKLNLVMPCFAVKRVGDDGSILLIRQENGQLTCRNNQQDIPAFVLLKNFEKVDLGKAQFNLGLEVEQDRCCDVTTINDDGKILGLLAGKPVIKSGEKYEEVFGDRAVGLAFNERGDVLFQPTEGNPRLRLKGTIGSDVLEFPHCEITKQLDGVTDDLLTTNALDMSETGQVLFWAKTGASSSLSLATPRRELVPPGLSGQLTFSGSTIAALTKPWRITGSFSAGSFALALREATDDPCRDRTFTAFASTPAGGWTEGSLVQATTQISGGQPLVGSASLSDNGQLYVASAGGFRITNVSASGFTATPEGLVLKKQGGTETYEVSGAITVKR